MMFFKRTYLKRIVLSAVMLIGFMWTTNAQSYTLSTNVIEWCNYGTINLDAGMSLSRHFTINAGCKYNPWEFQTKNGMPVMNNQLTAYLGTRYWFFFANTGWWLGARMRFSDFEQTGVLRPKYILGKSLGAGVSAGYTWLLTDHFSIEFAAGLWGGRHLKYEQYRTYDNKILDDRGPRNFIALDDISLSLVYVF